MRAVVQRVSTASVRVDDEVVGSIGRGLVVFVGVAAGDGQADIEYIAAKIRDLRVFKDESDRMSLSVVDIGGSVLIVSQFTLLGDARRGRRPDFTAAEQPERARVAYESLIDRVRAMDVHLESGRFQAAMDVSLVNDGPVTILLDSRRRF